MSTNGDVNETQHDKRVDFNMKVQEQRERSNHFRKFRRNFGKDSKTTKAKEGYFDKKLEKLNEWWVVFEEKHAELVAFGFSDDDYFKMKIFELMRKEFEEFKLQIEKEKRPGAPVATTSTAWVNSTAINGASVVDLLNDDDEEQETGLGEAMPPEMRVLNFQHDGIKHAMIEASNADVYRSKGIAGALLENIKVLWLEFRATYCNLATAYDANFFENIDYNELQREYVQVCGKLNEIVIGGGNNNGIVLPKIKLPEFDGTSWIEFKDLFNEIVHNNRSLSNGVKVQYLKMSLKGEAAAIVNHLGPHEENYETVYELLKRRYDNKRKMVGDLIDKMLNLPKQNYESGEALRKLHDTVNECMMAIANLNVPTKEWDPIVIHILMKKLSKITILDYEGKISDVRELKTLKSFLSYVEERFMALIAAESNNEKNNEQKGDFKKTEKDKKIVPFLCTYCEKSHSIYKCNDFLKLDPAMRLEWVKEKKVCFVCLQQHKQGECKSRFNCKKCSKKHNTLLHIEKKERIETLMATTSDQNESENKDIEKSNDSRINTLLATKDHENLLATARVKVSAKNGERMNARSVVDMGSQSAMITERLVQLLALKSETVYIAVDTVDECNTQAYKRVKLEIASRFQNGFVFTTYALVMKKITSLSVFKGDLAAYSHLQNLQYADPSILSDDPIDLLLGVADYSRILSNGLIKGSPNEPVAQNSELGWLIFGPQKDPNQMNDMNEMRNIKVNTLLSNIAMMKKMNDFIENENMDENSDSSDDDEKLTEEEEYCENHYVKTTRRENDGRFVVSMAFKNGELPKLGDSKKTAIATLFQLEKRFAKNTNLKMQYAEAVHEAINLGHMVVIKNPPNDAHYIPHHAVMKDSSTTKLRQVFNASQKTKNGMSLNEQLAIGKIVQPTIFQLMLRWRQHRIAVVADLEKMYKQLKIDQSQYKYQMVLWRDHPSEPIRTYALTTVTFGLGDSPYLAMRTLRELSTQVKNSYPLAAKAINDNFYMDNFAGGADTVKQANELCNQLVKTFESAKFNLRKFASNSEEFIQRIPLEKREKVTDEIIISLGIAWNPTKDTFSLKIKIDEKQATTKRELFSQIASLYDPIGWAAPAVIKARILMQKTWLENLNWDEKLPSKLVETWCKIKEDIPLLSKIAIPRWVKISPESNIQIHGFCDASELAYGACVYVRVQNEDNIETTLLTAKTRVSPNKKKLTIPKLELCGALLLTKLTKQVIKTLKLENVDIYLWSDSQIVIAWINSNEKRYKKFVFTRVSKVKKIMKKHLKKSVWCHIDGKNNPADYASRGMFARELINNELWFNGPTLLRENSDFKANSECKFETAIEKVNILMSTQETCILPSVSSIKKLCRIVAYVYRFINGARKNKTKTDRITVNEMQNAMSVVIQVTQQKYFPNEYEALKNGKNISKKSSVKNLDIFMDNNIIRVGGRLRNATIPFDMKHQILLPGKSELTTLIIREFHHATLHGGPKTTESNIRQKYWILHSQRSIKRELKQCLICCKSRPSPMNQVMADLPAVRVEQTEKVFLKCAVDFAGPIQVKTSKIRAAKIVKGYIAIFVCMATKAMHIELVGDLTAESFIAALRRFVAKRGYVTDIYSDNGTNFVKSEKILQELSMEEKEQFMENLENVLLKHEIKWHFAPPASPHFNGLAEAAVKTTKYHIRRTINETPLTFEEWATLLAQIESIANSRPLCGLSSSPNDTMILTPAHFLQLQPVELIPNENIDECKTNYLSRWQTVQRLVKRYWIQWRKEYLNQLQIRQKWHEKQPNVNIGDLVTIVDDNMPPAKWTLGRIKEKHTGPDGCTRVVTIKTAKNEIKRSITKIAPMPVKLEEDQAKKHENVVAAAKITTNPVVKNMTILLCVVMWLSTAVVNAHQFTLLENKQELKNNQTTNVSINWKRESQNHAITMVSYIALTIFIGFLLYLLRLFCAGGSTSQNRQINENQIGMPMQMLTTPIQSVPNTIISMQSNSTPIPSAPVNMTFQTWNNNNAMHMQNQSSNANNGNHEQMINCNRTPLYHDRITPCPTIYQAQNEITNVNPIINSNRAYGHHQHTATPRPTMKQPLPTTIVEEVYERERRTSTNSIWPWDQLREAQDVVVNK
jgi:hypothetical protein